MLIRSQDAPPTTPLDIRLGLTKAEDINFKLRWGFVSASAIGSDWIKSLQDVPGAEFQAIWARDHEAGKLYAEKHGINVAHAVRFGSLLLAHFQFYFWLT